MPYFAQFLADLFETGDVRVPLAGHTEEVDVDSARVQELLRGRDRIVRLELPCVAPEFDLNAALVGARFLYLGCQAFVDRGPTTEPLYALADEARNDLEVTPAVVYSIDLTLTFLPDLYRQAALLASGDLLVDIIRSVANDWPLSSVGIPGLESIRDPSDWMIDPALAQLYIDRILAYDDASRLLDPDTSGRLRRSLGTYAHELAGTDVLALLESLPG